MHGVLKSRTRLSDFASFTYFLHSLPFALLMEAVENVVLVVALPLGAWEGLKAEGARPCPASRDARG